jgi:hypothetical protein
MAHCTHIQFTALTAQGNAVKHAKAVEIHMYCDISGFTVLLYTNYTAKKNTSLLCSHNKTRQNIPNMKYNENTALGFVCKILQ